jgi:RNA polymerase sigma factor (sigma-70 family)
VFDYSPLPVQHDGAAVTTPERSLEDECEALRAAMAKLMPDVRKALEMRYGSDSTFEEIGAELCCSHTTARALVAAGLAKLKSMMERT